MEITEFTSTAHWMCLHMQIRWASKATSAAPTPGRGPAVAFGWRLTCVHLQVCVAVCELHKCLVKNSHLSLQHLVHSSAHQTCLYANKYFVERILSLGVARFPWRVSGVINLFCLISKLVQIWKCFWHDATMIWLQSKCIVWQPLMCVPALLCHCINPDPTCSLFSPHIVCYTT